MTSSSILLKHGHALLGCLALASSLLPGHADPAAQTTSDQPIRPGEVWLDDKGVAINAHGGGILFYDGTYYWFGEHKIAGPGGNNAEVGVHCYSSTDLHNWKDEGIALAVSEDPQSDIARGCILERPKVIYNQKTGKFVMWFHLERKGKGYNDARSGVAVADKVTGPYRFVESFRPNAGMWPQNLEESKRGELTAEEKDKVAGKVKGWFPALLIFKENFAGGQMARDMTLFVDEDGTAYHIYSSEGNRTLQISKLTDDYLRPAGEFVRVFPDDYNEAPAVVKHSGKYYMISSGCSGWDPNAARSAVADSMMGPWKALGNPCRGVEEENKTTFRSQSTFLLPVQGTDGGVIFMADRWNPGNAIDGRYVWLPLEFSDGKPTISWKDSWSVSEAFPPAGTSTPAP